MNKYKFTYADFALIKHEMVDKYRHLISLNTTEDILEHERIIMKLDDSSSIESIPRETLGYEIEIINKIIRLTHYYVKFNDDEIYYLNSFPSLAKMLQLRKVNDETVPSADE